MKKKRTVLISIVSCVAIVGILSIYKWQKDPCLNLEPCEQYECLNPQFYCVKTLYESNIRPTCFEDAQQIVMAYIRKKRGLTAEVISSFKVRDPYQWYQITCQLSDGSQYGYEVGPDGNIYEIKHRN